VPEGKKPAVSYSLIKSAVTFDSPKTREEGRGPAGLVLTKSPTLASVGEFRKTRHPRNVKFDKVLETCFSGAGNSRFSEVRNL
jgi:hypothetical protein